MHVATRFGSRTRCHNKSSYYPIIILPLGILWNRNNWILLIWLGIKRGVLMPYRPSNTKKNKLRLICIILKTTLRLSSIRPISLNVTATTMSTLFKKVNKKSLEKNNYNQPKQTQTPLNKLMPTTLFNSLINNLNPTLSTQIKKTFPNPLLPKPTHLAFLIYNSKPSSYKLNKPMVFFFADAAISTRTSPKTSSSKRWKSMLKPKTPSKRNSLPK